MGQRARSKYPGGNPGHTPVVLGVLLVAFLVAGFFARAAEVFRLGLVVARLLVFALVVFDFVFFDFAFGMASS